MNARPILGGGILFTLQDDLAGRTYTLGLSERQIEAGAVSAWRYARDYLWDRLLNDRSQNAARVAAARIVEEVLHLGHS